MDENTTLNEARRKFPRTYALLKASGHSPLKAFEILLDAKRGDEFARHWVRCMFAQRRNNARYYVR